MKLPAIPSAAAATLLFGLAVLAVSVETQERARGPLRLAATRVDEVRAWDARVIRMERAGDLAVVKRQSDTLVPGRIFVRLQQLHRGVPVWDGEVVREEDAHVTTSILTNLYQRIDIGTEPALSSTQAKHAIENLGQATLGPNRRPQLVVYPMTDGSFRLVYTERVATMGDVRRYFVDANTGELVDDYSEVLRQAAVGTGTGVLGDTKKISTTQAGGVYVTDDGLRPPALHTYDLRGDVVKYLRWNNGEVSLSQSDLASDTDNTWTDPAVVDAHVHIGWTYDYFFKRMGRRGLNDNDSRALPVVHVVHRSDFRSYWDAGLIGAVELFYINAFYVNGTGTFTFGEGLPAGWTYGGQTYNYLAGGLDIVAHEYGHGIVDYTSHFANRGEPRSLNEAFADITAVSVDYCFRSGRANYTIGEEVISGGIRSLSNPASFGDLDHYSKRRAWIDHEYENSTIASHAFYLAIEGGTNRTSGRRVEGVGAGNREQIEKSFYRGFTSLPSQATFLQARARTIESARVLYGEGSAAHRAVTQAWDAVGVL